MAEATKVTENIYRCVNIALVNELKMIYDRMGIDVWEVLEAAATKPFGFGKKENKTFFTPGPGLGGHCIPIDPFYLTWKAREYGVATRFIELAGEINTGMPDYVVSRLMLALNDRGRALRGAKVLRAGPGVQAGRGRHAREPLDHPHRETPGPRRQGHLQRPVHPPGPAAARAQPADEERRR